METAAEKWPMALTYGTDGAARRSTRYRRARWIYGIAGGHVFAAASELGDGGARLAMVERWCAVAASGEGEGKREMEWRAGRADRREFRQWPAVLERPWRMACVVRRPATGVLHAAIEF